MDHNAHCYAFWNAPLSQRVAWTRNQIAQLDARIDAGGFESADAYYAVKNHRLKLAAGLVGKHESEIDPMGFWFGMQSN